MIEALKAGQVDLNDPAVTVELLRLNAVAGVRGKVSETGIGKRLDGYANIDLNVGAIVALAPALGRGHQGGVQCVGSGQV